MLGKTGSLKEMVHVGHSVLDYGSCCPLPLWSIHLVFRTRSRLICKFCPNIWKEKLGEVGLYSINLGDIIVTKDVSSLVVRNESSWPT